jgi:hypothetical protein
LGEEERAQLLRALRSRRRPPPLAEAVPRGDISLRRQLVRCGKPRCPCNAGAAAAAGVAPVLHGPYWYAWWRDRQGQKRSAYVGKALRRERVEAQVRLLEGAALSLQELEELAAVTEAEVEAGWAGEAPGEAAKSRVAGAVARGEVRPTEEGTVPAAAAVAWLEALGALGFSQRRRRG